jgi:hypothetical protein
MDGVTCGGNGGGTDIDTDTDTDTDIVSIARAAGVVLQVELNDKVVWSSARDMNKDDPTDPTHPTHPTNASGSSKLDSAAHPNPGNQNRFGSKSDYCTAVQCKVGRTTGWDGWRDFYCSFRATGQQTTLTLRASYTHEGLCKGAAVLSHEKSHHARARARDQVCQYIPVPAPVPACLPLYHIASFDEVGLVVGTHEGRGSMLRIEI